MGWIKHGELKIAILLLAQLTNVKPVVYHPDPFMEPVVAHFSTVYQYEDGNGLYLKYQMSGNKGPLHPNFKNDWLIIRLKVLGKSVGG